MFTTLKSVVAATVIAAMALAASCSYDDSGINQRVDRVEKDLAALTERVAALEKKLDEQVEALTKLINGKTVVTKVEAAEDGSTKVTLSDGSSFVVYPKAEESTNTEVATDTTVAPYKAEDGVYYWAIFDGGKFQKYLEVDGQKVPVFAAEAEEGESCACDLKFSVDEKTGKLLVSIDGGKTWVDSGLAAQQVAPTGVFSEVVVNDNNTVTFTLADGEKFTVALAELIECEATRSGVYVLPGEVKAVRFTVNDAVEDINIMNQPHGWAATVEVAPAEEENGDDNVGGPAVGPLAVGGTDYVLNIAGPAVGDKYAAKEGVVSVHFNTASGACKVLSVNVNLAELTLSIDNAGNITITNSVALEQTDYFGNKFVDFADFWIGIMPAELYEADGEDALQNDYFMQGYFDNASVTNRTGGLRNFLQDDMAIYEEGVCEFETISITMEELCQEVLYPTVNMTLGARYVVFLSLGNDTTPDAYIIPSLENAIVAEYSYVMADAKLVEGSESWNDATFDFALAGYTHYIVGWHAKSEVDGYISERVCDSYADYLSKRSMDYLFGIGAVISGNIDGEVALSKVIEDYLDPVWGEMCMIPQILTDTEYYFFVYPLNIQSEMDVYMHKFDVNALTLSSFATTALVEGEFEADVTFGEPKFSGNGHVEVAVEVKTDGNFDVAYHFYEDEAVSVSGRVEEMLADEYYTEYVKLDDTKAFTAIKDNSATNPTYLSVLLINADGEYAFVEQKCEFVYEQEAFVSFEFLGRSYELDDNPETGGGDYVYLAKTADGEEYTFGVYYSYAGDDNKIKEGTLNYTTNALNAMYSYWSGFVVVSDTKYENSTLTVDADGKIVWTLLYEKQYIFDPNAQGGETPEPEEPEQSAVTFTSVEVLEGDTFYGWEDFQIKFAADNGDYLVANAYQLASAAGAFYEGEFYFSTGAPCFFIDSYSYASIGGVESDVYGGKVVIAEVDGKYSFTFTGVYIMVDGEFATFDASFLGTIEGMILPSQAPAYDYDLTFTKCENLDGNNYTFTNNDGYTWVMSLLNPIAEGELVGEAGNWDGNNTTIQVPGASYPGYIYDGTFTVAKDGDNYAITFVLESWINGAKSKCRFVYNGPISTGSDEPEVYEGVEITSFSYVARSYELDDDPETGGGDFVYDVACADGSQFRLGLYWSLAESDGTIKNGKYSYCTNYFNAMYSSWNGFVIISDTMYYGAQLVVTDTQIALVLPDATYVYNR